MAKVSRPVVYAVVAAVAAYAVVLLTEPEKPASAPKKRSTLGAGTKAPTGFLPEDMTAQFAPYSGKGRDAFRPEIVPKQAVLNALPSSKPAKPSGLFSQLGLRGSWTLTGINIVNGGRSALIENTTTGDSAFLKEGDSWNGLQVVTIETNTVVFLNTLGQRTQLKFEDPSDESSTLPGVAPASGSGPGRTIVTVTPINKNGLNIAPGGVAPVVPTLPAPTGPATNVPPAPGRQR